MKVARLKELPLIENSPMELLLSKSLPKQRIALRRVLKVGVLALLSFSCGLPLHLSAQTAPASTPHTFRVEGNAFLYDGKPLQVLSGEMHYPRIPRAYWRDRLKKAKAMGLNTISTYVFWNVHEPRPGVYDFKEQNDLAEFLHEAQEEGLHVILRPGPYVCAEWEFGGFPSWLLKDRELVLRSNNPQYMAAVERWFTRLAQELKPQLIENGGPVMAVQVENEYGSFGSDHEYMKAMEAMLKKVGFTNVLLYTADPPKDLPKGSLPDLPAVINFGTGDAEKSFAKLATMRPEGPRMSGEYWAGWFDGWGAKHHATDSKREADEFGWMVKQGYSANLYMFHGGSNFGWMNGSNSNGKDFKPDTTSYDYNAPLDEKGEPREKYFLFRNVIAEATHATLPPVPPTAPRKTFPIAPKMETASLWRNLPDPVSSKTLLTMEDLDQSYGYILYRAGLDEGDGGELVLDGLHDYAQVYVDQKLVGTLDRRLGETHLTIPTLKAAGTLDILVENTGRVNYTEVIRQERKGITGKATLAGKEFRSWEIYSLPMNDHTKLRFAKEACSGPCFYRAEMTVDTVADTYIDTKALHKGTLWINDRPLGRFWSIGPQFQLYTPGPWLHAGQNSVVFFDLQADATDKLTTVKDPNFGDTISERDQ